jgi:OOP family OmpA-OmpF porin
MQEPMALQSIILFHFDKRDMNNALTSTKSRLDEMIAKLKSPDISVNRVTVVGHADKVNISGVRDYNNKLAQDRAEAAKSYLINKGIDANLINVVSKADSEQIETCDARLKSTQQLQQCLANNRRVEVIVDAIKLK